MARFDHDGNDRACAVTEDESGLSVVEQTADDALLRAVADPVARPLIGTKIRP